MGRDSSLKEIAEFIQGEAEWVITGHTMPDGDCIGSVIALQLGLQALGKRATAVLEDPAPLVYRYLKGFAGICTPEQAEKNTADNVIYLDCADQERIGENVRVLTKQHRKSVNIDHHYTNNRYADLNYVDSGAAATGELIYELLRLLGSPVGADIADALYAALVMDTNNFVNANTSSRSFRLAAELLECGASVTAARLHLFESKDRREMEMIRMALDTISFSPRGRVAWAEIPHHFIKSIGAEGFHPEGIVNYLLMPEGVDVAVLFREIAPDATKISLRSKHDINVADLAARFGGGGHPPAAGARLDCELQAAKVRVLEYVIGSVEGATGEPNRD